MRKRVCFVSLFYFGLIRLGLVWMLSSADLLPICFSEVILGDAQRTTSKCKIKPIYPACKACTQPIEVFLSRLHKSVFLL